VDSTTVGNDYFFTIIPDLKNKSLINEIVHIP